MKKITVLIPCYNEQENLDALHRELSRFVGETFHVAPEGADPENIDMMDYEWEFLFVNDGSTDNTLPMLREMQAHDSRITVVNLSRNFGKENAMLAGIDNVAGDAVVIIDADLQDPLEVIPEMIYWWKRGYDDIYGQRMSRGKESIARKGLSQTFYRTLDKMCDIEITPNVGDFRLLDRKSIEALSDLRETQRYTKGLFFWIGFNKKGVKYNKNDREAGKSKYNFRKLSLLAIDGITSFTISPLRYAGILGIVISFFSFIYLAYFVIKTLIWGEEVTGFPTLITVILFLGGIQLLALGIIGEYIGRIFNEVKRRPPYIVDEIFTGKSHASNLVNENTRSDHQ